MKNGTVNGISYPDNADIDELVCLIYFESRQAIFAFQTSSSKTEDALEVIYSDVEVP